MTRRPLRLLRPLRPIVLLVALLGVAACRKPATDAPSSHADALASGAGAPNASAPPSASAAPSGDPCEQACAYIRACTSADLVTSCVRDCRNDFAPADGGERFRACVTSFACQDLDRALVKNEGPLGACLAGRRGK